MNGPETPETTEYMGYRVEWTGNDSAPFTLHGKRGACYGGMRANSRDGGGVSEWCFLVNGRTGVICTAKGNAWFRVPFGGRQITGCR